MIDQNNLLTLLSRLGVRYEESCPLSRLTSFRIGGPARIAVFPESPERAVRAMDALKESGVPFTVIGNGTNLLAPDGGYDGAVVVMTGVAGFSASDPDNAGGRTLTVGAGMPVTLLASRAAKLSLTGLEFAYGIPGTVGGGIYMNAGAYGGQVSDVVVSSRWYDPETGETGTLDAPGHDFAYRHSSYMENGRVIISAEIRLAAGDADTIGAAMKDYMSRRCEKQPLDLPSAGSVFKRGNGFITAKLIEECGLKGRRVGGAEVSLKHAGFIVNRGGATARDVLTLADIVRDEVFEKTGKTIEREIRTLPDGKY